MRGVLAYGVAFIIVALVLIFLFFVANPIILTTNTYLAEAGSDLMQDLNVSAISNSEVQEAMNNSVQDAMSGIPKSSQIIGLTVKYAWLIFLIVVFVLFFVMTRELSESSFRRGLM